MCDWWRFCKDEEFATNSRLACECQLAKRPREKLAHAGIWRVFSKLDYTSHFATQAKSQVTHETPCLMILNVSFHIPLPILYKPSLPTKYFLKKYIFFKKTFEKENPSQTLESYKFFTHNHLHRFSKISFTPTLYLHILERFLTQTLTSPILSVERSSGVYEKH